MKQKGIETGEEKRECGMKLIATMVFDEEHKYIITSHFFLDSCIRVFVAQDNKDCVLAFVPANLSNFSQGYVIKGGLEF